MVYNALETATGSFVLLHEWVLQWQKMGPCLTSQEKEKIDKCKRQVGKPAWWNTEWEDQIKASLSYMASLRPAWAAEAPVLDSKLKEKCQ